MMYTQGLKRLASNQGAINLLLATSSRTVRVGMVNQSAQSFSIISNEQVQ